MSSTPYSPLSPSAISFLKGTLNSPSTFTCPQILTPCRLDSPSLQDSGVRTWGMATAETLSKVEDDCEFGSWANELPGLLCSSPVNFKPAFPSTVVVSSNPILAFSAPVLLAYNSDGESPDSTPASSDVEDSPKHSGCSKTNKKRKNAKRTLQEITSSSLVSVADSCRFKDETDEIVRNALLEDSKEEKAKLFPGLIAHARQIVLSEMDKEKSLENLGINALLSAFTNDDKTGRPLPKSCQELLRIATDEVAQARKRQRENKTRRTSVIHNQLDTAVFTCNAKDCKKRYTTAEGLRLHIRNHHDVDKKWICHSVDCTSERSFVRQADLRMHLIRMHSPVRPFPCRVPDCSKTFACHSELRRHIATDHTDLVHSICSCFKQ